ncbi:MAG: O-antigen ligase family protein, partial [Candidatus Omnitrophota bacterium]|nr:O-antigen ligase family protein [Candidatus Omnitrophota bacterium]
MSILNKPETWRRLQVAALVAFAVALPIGQAPTEAALIVGLMAWIVGTCLEGHWRQAIPRTPLNLLLLAWWLVAAASMVNSVDLRASLQGLRKLLKYFVLYLLVVESAGTRGTLRKLIIGCVIGLSLVTIDGLWQWFVGKDLFLGNPIGDALGGSVRRVQATFHHPGSLSIYLVSFVPLVVALALRGNKKWRWPLLGAVALTIAVVVLHRSRAGVIAFLLGLIFLGYWLRSWLPVALAGLTAVLQAATVPPAVKAWAATMPSLFEQLAQPDRPLYWQAAINMFTAHPIIGVGINTFTKAYTVYCNPGDPFAHVGPYAHNQYLHLAAELGWLGVIVFALVLVVVF